MKSFSDLLKKIDYNSIQLHTSSFCTTLFPFDWETEVKKNVPNYSHEKTQT